MFESGGTGAEKRIENGKEKLERRTDLAGGAGSRRNYGLRSFVAEGALRGDKSLEIRASVP